MEIRILGPIELIHDGVKIALPRRQQRLLLALLALEANRPVDRERLVALLWGIDRPARAIPTLQTRMSELRSILTSTGAPVRLETLGQQYLLRVDEGRVDSRRFTRLLEESRAADAASKTRALCREALGLWRGGVLGGFASDDPHAAVCETLEADRLAILELLFAAELELGNHAEIADEVVAVVNEHPTQERFVVHLLFALHRAGRKPEALTRYDRWRRWLADELGVDPGAEVEAAYRAVLADEPPAPPALDHRVAGPFVPWMLPPAVADFTGREDDVRELQEAVLSGRHAVTVVSGAAGLGKTTLAVQVAHQIAEQFPHGVLYVNLRDSSGGEPMGPEALLDQCLRALGVDGAVIPESVSEGAALFRTLVADRQILLVLDNAVSDQQIGPVLPSGRDNRVIVTSRRSVGMPFGARTLMLSELHDDDALDLLSRIVGSARVAAEPEAAVGIYRHCGNSPLAVRIAAAKLASRPHWPLRKMLDDLTDERRRLDVLSHEPLDVRESLELSYKDLDSPAKVLLERLGGLDIPYVTVWLAAALLDTTMAQAEQRLERLLDAQLLSPDGFAGDWPRYRLHDLVRLFAREKGVHTDDAVRHEYLTRGFGACLRLADDWWLDIAGGKHHGIHSAAPRWPSPPEPALELGLAPIPSFDCERAVVSALIRRAVRAGHTAAAWDIACKVFDPFLFLRLDLEAERILTLAQARTRQDDDELGTANILLHQAVLEMNRSRPVQALTDYEHAWIIFDRLGDPTGRALAVFGRSIIHRQQGRLDRARRDCVAAIRWFRTAGDFAGEARAIHHLAHIALTGENGFVANIASAPLPAPSCSMGIWAGPREPKRILAEAQAKLCSRAFSVSTTDTSRLH
ncbi:BTAD domain-containing putative transcriptional regulator [Actinoplanes sp. NPDC051859]|uniref:AfsR/SARP family transcriptional regulator n=1 Tax=Actinoplanes sp. NPDC051859 TaxID=3363909 RepID=UPI0037B820A6